MNRDDLREEARRIIPGMLIAGAASAKDDYAVLLKGFLSDCQRAGVPADVAQMLMFNAAMHWARVGVATIAQMRGVDGVRPILEDYVKMMSNETAP